MFCVSADVSCVTLTYKCLLGHCCQVCFIVFLVAFVASVLPGSETMAPKSKAAKVVVDDSLAAGAVAEPKAKRAKVAKPADDADKGVVVETGGKKTAVAPKVKAAPKAKVASKPKASVGVSSDATSSSVHPPDVSKDDDVMHLETQFEGDDHLAWLLSQGELTVEAIAETYKVGTHDAKAIYDQVRTDFEAQYGDDIMEWVAEDATQTKTTSIDEPEETTDEPHDVEVCVTGTEGKAGGVHVADAAGNNGDVKPLDRTDSQHTEWLYGCNCCFSCCCSILLLDGVNPATILS